jgi:hypothetical protein
MATSLTVSLVPDSSTLDVWLSGAGLSVFWHLLWQAALGQIDSAADGQAFGRELATDLSARDTFDEVSNLRKSPFLRSARDE